MKPTPRTCADCTFTRGEALGLLVVVCALAYLLFDSWSSWDFALYDGVFHLRAARDWPQEGLALKREYFPLYRIYYSAFHRLLPDDPHLVYLAHRASTYLLTVVLFWLLARRFLSWELSTVLTVGLLLNHALLTDIHVVHLAGLCFALAVLLWTSRDQNPALLFWLSAAGFFVRPEFAVCLLVTGPYALFQLFRAPRGWRDWLTASAIALCLLTISLVIISEAPRGHSRAFIAFSQQSAWAEARAAGRHGVSGHFDHLERTRRIFGNAHTIPGAAISNPVAFAEHLVRNVASLPSKLLWTSLPGGPGAPVVPLTFLVAYLLALILGRQKRAPPTSFWVAGTGFALSVLAAGLLFRPDPIYLLAGLPLLTLGITLALLSLSRRASIRAQRPRRVLQGALLVAVAALPLLAGQPFHGQDRPVVQFSKVLSGADSIADPVDVFAFSAVSYCELITRTGGRPCTPHEPAEILEQRSLRQLLRHSSIDALVVSGMVGDQFKRLGLEDLKSFEQNPESFGFRRADETQWPRHVLYVATGRKEDAQVAEKPLNLVVVVLDTLRADHLGLYGYQRATSPHLDAFAGESFVFERAESAAPWTAPSLISLVTSLYPEVHGVRGWPNPRRMSDDAVTLAEVLKQHGYSTAAFTEGGYAKGDFGLDQGFDTYPRNPGDDKSHNSHMIFSSRLEGNLARSLSWLGEHEEEPFFLFFQTYEPHEPYRAPEEFVRRFRPDYDEDAEHQRVQRAIQRWNLHRQVDPADSLLVQRHRLHCRPTRLHRLRDQQGFLMANLAAGLDFRPAHQRRTFVEWMRDIYDAEIAYTDEQMSRLWRFLQEEGLYDQTLVLVVSDHGEGLGDHGQLQHGQVLFEEILRIALILRTPHRLGEPRQIPQLVRSVDLMPTLFELMGISTADLPLQGRSLVPLLEGQSLELHSFGHARAVSEEEDTLYSVRSDRWRLVLDRTTGAGQLYDLSQDPGETRDVADANPEVVASLRKLLDRQGESDRALAARVGPPAPPVELDEGLRRELRALGYLSAEGDD